MFRKRSCWVKISLISFLLMSFRNNGLISFCVSQNIRRIHSHAWEQKKREKECWSVVKMILISHLVVVSFIFTCFDKRFCNQLLAKCILQTTDILKCYTLCSFWLHFFNLSLWQHCYYPPNVVDAQKRFLEWEKKSMLLQTQLEMFQLSVKDMLCWGLIKITQFSSHQWLQND